MEIDFDKGNTSPKIDQESCIRRANEEIVELLDLLFDKNGPYSQESFLDAVKRFAGDATIRIPYYQVTVYVNVILCEGNGNSQIKNAKLNDAKQRLMILSESKNPPIDVNIGKLLIKIQDHIDLAEHQYSTLDSKASSIKQAIEEESQKLKESLSLTSSEIDKLKNSVYSQIIAIVAIFTGIAFILFGGVSAIGGIKEAVQSNGAAFLRVLSYACVIGVFTLGALLIFFNFVLIILEKKSLGTRWFILEKNIIIAFLIIGFLLALVAFNVDVGIGKSLFWILNR